MLGTIDWKPTAWKFWSWKSSSLEPCFNVILPTSMCAHTHTPTPLPTFQAERDLRTHISHLLTPFTPSHQIEHIHLTVIPNGSSAKLPIIWASFPGKGGLLRYTFRLTRPLLFSVALLFLAPTWPEYLRHGRGGRSWEKQNQVIGGLCSTAAEGLLCDLEAHLMRNQEERRRREKKALGTKNLERQQEKGWKTS